MERPLNINCSGKAFKFIPQQKSLQIEDFDGKSLQIQIAVKKPSDIYRNGKAFKLKSRDGKAFEYKPGGKALKYIPQWESLQIENSDGKAFKNTNCCGKASKNSGKNILEIKTAVSKLCFKCTFLKSIKQHKKYYLNTQIPPFACNPMFPHNKKTPKILTDTFPT